MSILIKSKTSSLMGVGLASSRSGICLESFYISCRLISQASCIACAEFVSAFGDANLLILVWSIRASINLNPCSSIIQYERIWDEIPCLSMSSGDTTPTHFA